VATQRLTIANVGGEAAREIVERFAHWSERRNNGDSDPLGKAIDQFAGALRANAGSPPVLYFCEWFDHWSMGDMLPGVEFSDGNRFQVACLESPQVKLVAANLQTQFPEQRWLGTRLREALEACNKLAATSVLVILREPLGRSITDEEIVASLQPVPDWLLSL
jgi:hypothetical protein